MELQAFMDALLRAAGQAGMEAAEIYYTDADSFSAKAQGGVIDQYQVSSSSSLSLRGSVGGKMGYAATEAFDSDAIAYLVEAVKDSASLNEAAEQDRIFAGEETYPSVPPEEDDLDTVTSRERLDLALQSEAAALAADPRITQTEGAALRVNTRRVILRNTCGLNLIRTQRLYTASVLPIARQGGSTATGFHMEYGRCLRALDPAKLGQLAAADALAQLGAQPVPSGEYPVIFRYDAMQSLLQVFSGIFSAENAQQRMSLLAGREGDTIASPLVTLVDDPLMPGGLATTPFDDEGSATRTKMVVSQGVLQTLLHNRRTAARQGVQTTGNARRAGGMHVAPANFYLQPGSQPLEALLEEMQNGLLITDVSGLHAGANPISGDFSLLSKGFVVRNGRQAEPVERITVAGNFYQLLQAVRTIGSDLVFLGSPIGSPSVYVGPMAVSGK